MTRRRASTAGWKAFALCLTGFLAIWAAAMAGDVDRDPFAGRWKLDPQKSRFPGKAPISEDFSFEIGTDGVVRFAVEEVRESGTVVASWTGRLDGADYPISGAPGRDTLAMARITDTVIMGVYKNKGIVTYAFVRSVSDDGQTMQSRVLGSAGPAQPVDVFITHERYAPERTSGAPTP